MINNLNKSMIRIKKFNMMTESLEGFDIFQNDTEQYIISRDLLEDYFSLVENDYSINIQLSIIKQGYGDAINISEVEEGAVYMGEISYYIELVPKNLDRVYCIDHGDYVTEMFDKQKFDKLSNCMSDINSIANKLESIEHSIDLGFKGGMIVCIIRNKKNNKLWH